MAQGISGALGDLGNIASGAVAFALGGVLKDAFDAVAGAAGNFLKSALDVETQQAGLAAVIKSTGGAAGLTQAAVNGLAQQFKNLVGGSDEAIVSIEEIGLRSGAISANQMPAFIKNVADLGAVMGSTSTAATLLARAQDDPVAAMGKLQRAGILFDESLKEQIKTLVKHHDVAGATALIMNRVTEATGGAAQANANTLSGRLEILRNRLEDAGKSIAEKLLPPLEVLFDNYIAPNIPVVEALAEKLANALGPALITVLQGVVQLVGVFTSAWPQIQAAIQGVVNFVLANLPLVQAAIVSAWQWFLANKDSIIGAFVAIGAVLVGAGIVAAIAGIGAAIAALLSPVGLVIIAVGVLGAAWAGNWFGIRDTLTAVWTGTILPTLTTLWNWLQVAVPAALAAMLAYWNAAWPAIQSALSNFWNNSALPTFTQLATWLQVNIPQAIKFAQDSMSAMIAWAVANWPVMQAAVVTAINNVDSIVRTVLAALQKFWADNGANIITIVQGMWSIIQTNFTVAAAALYLLVQGALNLIQGFWKTWGDTIIKILGDMYEALKGALQLFADIFRGKWGALGADIYNIFKANMQAAADFFSTIASTIIGNIQGILNFIGQLVSAIRGIPSIPSGTSSNVVVGGGLGANSFSNYGGSTSNTSYSVTVNTSSPFDVGAQLSQLRGMV